jgi:type I restriction enzyme S subunit
METKVPLGWNLTTLEEIVRKDGYGLVDGPFGSNLPASDYTLTGIPVIRGSNLSLGETKFVDDEFVFVSIETAQRLARSICRPGDIIFTKKGTLGQTGIVPERHAYSKFLLSSNQMKLSVDQSAADPLYVYYYVSTPQSREKIVRDAEATGVPKTNLAYLRTFPILLPPLPTQRAIARILGALDDKIELNRRQNATLEALARAIFQSWFIDFDPVRARADGRAPAAMDAATAALFPDGFDVVDGREVPRGWKLQVMNDAVELILGGDWGKDQESIEAPYPVLCIRGADIPDIQNGGMGRMPTRYLKTSSLTKRRLQPGDLVVEISGGSPTQSTGRPVLITEALINRLSLPLSCSNFCRIVRPSNSAFSLFLYFWLLWIYINDAFLPYENGTTGIKNLAFTNFTSVHSCISPPLSVLEGFHSLVQPLLTKHQHNGIEITTLAALRDSLLPRLLSGELRVRAAEEIVEGAL